jgi:multicomponent K+:H+ antiporter subunit E
MMVDQGTTQTPSCDPDSEPQDDDISFLDRWLPHPLLTITLVAMWAALLNQYSGINLLAGLVLGVLIPVYTGNFWPDRPTIRSPFLAMTFICVLMWDVIVANVYVAWIILFRPAAKMQSQWIAVPLDLKSAEAITALAATITLTPGTVTSDLSADGRTLLVHCLDVSNPKEEVQRIKDRYERRIKAIFP